MSRIVGSEAKGMKHHEGDLWITKENASEVRGLTSVGGDLEIYVDAPLSNLTTVGGSLYIHAAAPLSNLTTVGGDLEINAAAPLSNLTTVGGDLEINAAAPLSNLTTVGGSLFINADAPLSNLTSVGGSLVIRVDAPLSNLTSVGGDLVIYVDALLSKLTSVGGSLVIRAGRFDIEAEVSLPALTSVHGAAMPDPAVAHERLVAVARQVLANPETLDMGMWHCGTSHCVGGWAVTQAGQLGQKLEEEHGILVAPTLLLGVPGAKLFYLSNEAAMARLTKIASAQGPT